MCRSHISGTDSKRKKRNGMLVWQSVEGEIENGSKGSMGNKKESKCRSQVKCAIEGS